MTALHDWLSVADARLRAHVACGNVRAGPKLTIGGPNLLLKDARGIAIDPKSKDVIVSDKTLNAVFRFHVPEAFR